MAPYVPKPEREEVNYTLQHQTKTVVTLLTGIILVASIFVVALGTAGEFIVTRLGGRVERFVFTKLSSHFGDETFPEGQRILQKLIGDEAATFQVRILCADIPNAFAVPGYQIVVTSGALQYVKSEQGLAFLLAHEYGHFAHRDHLRGLGFGLGASFALTLMGLDEFGRWITDFTETLISRRFSKSQEAAADLIATEMLQRSYGSLAGATEFFEGVLKEHGEGRLDRIFSTHPLTKERIARLQATSNSDAPRIPIDGTISAVCAK